MREPLVNFFSKIIEGGIILLVFLLPLFFLPITTDSFELPKQILLVFFVSILAIFWAVKMIFERKVTILHSPLTIPLLIFFGIFFLSTIFSIHRFSSLFGSYPKLNDGLVSLFIFILAFFLIGSTIKEKKQIFRVLFSLSLAGLLISVLGIFHFFEFYPLSNLLRNPLLTPTGFADRAVFFLAILFPVPLFAFLFGKGKILQILSTLVTFLFLFYIVLISQIGAILGVFLVFLFAPFFLRFQIPKGIWLKMGITFLIFLFLFALTNFSPLKSQVPFLKEKFVEHELKITPDTAWTISIGSFQNLKLLALGSGPGTYIFDFTSLKPLRFNQTPLWDLRFEKAFNEYFQIFSTLGIFAFFAFLWILLRILKIAKATLEKVISEEKEKNLALLSFLPLFISLFTIFFTPFFTLISFTFWLFLAIALSFSRIIGIREVEDIELSFAAFQVPALTEKRGEVMPWLIALFLILILLPLLWQERKILRADLQLARAQIEQLKERPDGNLILRSQIQARDLLPNNDFYRRTLSATSLNFAILGEQQKALSEEAKQNLLRLAVTEGEIAVRLAPHNISNWENLQRVYTAVTLQNQADLLINNVFPQQILLDPFNPRHRNDLGWAYFNLRNDTELAKRNFQDAIFLKSDFADAHYNLARVYREEGKKDRALQEYEQTLNLLNQQILSLEPIASVRPDIQNILVQLKQSEQQIKKEKEELQAAIETEKTLPPTEEIKPLPEEIPGLPG